MDSIVIDRVGLSARNSAAVVTQFLMQGKEPFAFSIERNDNALPAQVYQTVTGAIIDFIDPAELDDCPGPEQLF